MMDTPSRSRPTSVGAQLAGGSESPAASKPASHGLSMDATSSLSLEGSTSSSGSVGQPDPGTSSSATVVCPSGPSDTGAMAAAATAAAAASSSPHHQTES